MKALFELIATICLFLSALFCSACKNNYDIMVQDFNKEFCVPDSKKIPENSINEDGFVATSMLLPRYLFKEGYEVTLQAPSGGKTYNWELVNSVRGKTIKESEEKTSVCNKQSYSFMPGEDFTIGTENKLVLTVTDDSGTEYIDTTIIIITSW